MTSLVGFFVVAVLSANAFNKVCVDAQLLEIPGANISPERAVNFHNEKRRIPGASNMKMMVWDTELASAAQAYAETCNFAHDSGRGNVGENIYLTSAVPTEVYVTAITSWYNEESDYDYGSGTCAAGRVCGHYTQIVWANSEKLGCGAARCRQVQSVSGFSNSIIVICRYSPPGNYVGAKPYTVGAACSNCPSGYVCNDGLCQDPSTASTTTSTTTTEEPTTSTRTSTPAPTQPTQTSSTTTTTVGNTNSPTQSTASSTTTEESTTSTSTSASTSTQPNTGGNTHSPTQSTGTTTQSPTQTGCTKEYEELRDQWIKAWHQWQKAFADWRDGNCPAS